jgi:hypothetical protein
MLRPHRIAVEIGSAGILPAFFLNLTAIERESELVRGTLIGVRYRLRLAGRCDSGYSPHL